MSDLMRQVLDVLVFASALCGLLLFAAAVIGFIVATVRVGILGRVLVLPFRGTDERRVELTALFARRLTEIEEECATLAHQIKDLKLQFEEKSKHGLLAPAHDADDALARSDVPLSPEVTDPSRVRALPTVGTAPRTEDDDLIDEIIQLDRTASLADADLGVVSVAGVSFSPQSVIALVRTLPVIFARRVLSGSIVSFGDTALVSVTYEERRLGRRSDSVRCRTEVTGERWLPAIADLAFEMAKGRIELLRRNRDRRTRSVLATSVSQTADRAVIEAQSWAAAEAFLHGYLAHLRHYESGEGEDRDRALDCYATAVKTQPGYARAIYHRATLLYNEYLPTANDEAIAGFEAATRTDDTRIRALSYAGLAMAYCQAVNRFGRDPAEVLSRAWSASEQSLETEPGLEEARFAHAWTRQIRADYEAAIAAYDDVAKRARDVAPAQRVASFALNNAGWIWLEPLKDRDGALLEAERWLWQAVRRYPNKIAYSNLAEIARRHERYADARALFEVSLTLDRRYAKGWNERACLEVEIASRENEGDETLATSLDYHMRAVTLADDVGYARQLRAHYEEALARHGLLDRVKHEEALASLT